MIQNTTPMILHRQLMIQKGVFLTRVRNKGRDRGERQSLREKEREAERTERNAKEGGSERRRGCEERSIERETQ